MIDPGSRLETVPGTWPSRPKLALLDVSAAVGTVSCVMSVSSVATSTLPIDPGAGLAAARARMAAIQARVGGTGSTSVNGPLVIEPSGPTDPTEGFDPFGQSYQDALLQAGVFSPVDPITGVALGQTVAADGTTVAADGTTVAADGTTGTSNTSATSGTSFSTGSSGQLYTQGVTPITASTVLTGPTWTGNAYPGTTGITVTGASSSSATGVSSPGYTGVPATGTTGSSVGQIGGYGQMPVPEELRVYGNGQIPAEALTSIGQGGHKLWGPAAESWKQAVQAAAADGVELKVTDSYRSYAEQVDLVRRKGLYENGGLAAVPGTSNHGWGLAVDVDITDPATLDWIRSNGYQYGFVEAVRREPWHWEYRPQQA